ncbi:MAG: hypothetical protein IKC03_11345 [Oscillospiraceae bacterium]|nr:hypothetical protein [Oscillospiraceae bacterium]
MKRFIASLLCLMLVLSVVGCGHKMKFDSSDVTMEAIVESITPSGLKVRISNNSNVDIYGGIADDFIIEKLEIDRWFPIEEITERSNNTEVFIFSGERDLTINWSELYGSLSEGEYRVVKSFFPCTEDGTYTSEDTFYLTAEFCIK